MILGEIAVVSYGLGQQNNLDGRISAKFSLSSVLSNGRMILRISGLAIFFSVLKRSNYINPRDTRISGDGSAFLSSGLVKQLCIGRTKLDIMKKPIRPCT